MNEPTKRDGKIIVHDEGAGVPSPEQVDARARELAVIAGRAGSDFNEGDVAQAKRELLHSGPATPADEDRAVAAVTTWDEAPGSTGHQTRNRGPQDETNIAQELVEEGLEEALHDEMLEAHKKNIDAGS
jgi:hypothetical protein